MPLLNTEAVTLRRRRTRDADALVTLWGRTCGKIVASTRSVLKSSSRFAGITQPFNRLQVILYAKYDDQDIWTLTQASLMESFDVIQSDLNRISYTSHLIEWIDALSGEFQSSERIWGLLLDIFNQWNQNPPRIEDLSYYQLHLLIDAGLQPQIGQCRNCQRSSSHVWFYRVQDGGFLCDACGRDGIRMSGGSVEILRRLSENSRLPSSIRMSNSQKEEIQKLLQNHGLYYSGLQSRSIQYRDFLSQKSMSSSSLQAVEPVEDTSS